MEKDTDPFLECLSGQDELQRFKRKEVIQFVERFLEVSILLSLVFGASL